MDLAVDYRALPPERSDLGPTLAVKEFAANKVLAVFDRAEARDFRDPPALVDGFRLNGLMRLAADKDPGFDKTRFIEALSAFDRLDPEKFDLDVDDFRRSGLWFRHGVSSSSVGPFDCYSVCLAIRHRAGAISPRRPIGRRCGCW